MLDLTPPLEQPEGMSDTVFKMASYTWAMDYLLRYAIQRLRDAGDPFHEADKLDARRQEENRRMGLPC